jgi:hypothetical protein
MLVSSVIAPELVWGLVRRGVGVLYILAFAGLIPELEALIGSRGLGPIAARLERAKRDFPGWRRFHLYPTLFWLSSSDRTIRVVPWLGVVCGICCVYGGPGADYAHALAWLLWLSLEPAMLIFPWDTLLQEAGFLALFLPSVQTLPSLAASAQPWPAVAFVFRFMVLRVMLGFAKVKFVGSKAQDSLYLRGFFVWSSGSPLAWYAHHLPAWILRGMLYAMFVCEAVAPLLGFFSGVPRLVSLGLLVSLMIGIQLTGNWGFFNVGYALLCLCLLDTQSSLLDLASAPWSSKLWDWPQLALNPVMAVLFVHGLLSLVALDSWTTRGAVQLPWDIYTWNRAWLRWLLAYMRALAPLRIVNGYGVFPAATQPPIREMPVFEGSSDGITWKAYRFRRMPSSAQERAKFVAPHHPRIDMATQYVGHSLTDGSFYGSLTGDGSPYAIYAGSSWLDRMCQRLLAGDPLFTRLFAHNPFAGAPPTRMRVAIDAMTISSPHVRRASGDFWHVRRCGMFVREHGKESWPDAIALPEPETFHPDWVAYKRRAAPLRAVHAAYTSGIEPARAILCASDLTPAEVQSFWQEFVPHVNAARGNFALHVEHAAELEASYGKLQLARFERILERFAWLLRLRTERHQFADALPKLPIESNFRYHMFLHELVMDGEAAYAGYLGDPALVVDRFERSTPELQLWTLAMLRHPLMVQHVATFRWTQIGADLHQIKAFGLFEYYPLLSECKLPGEEFRPLPSLQPDGEYVIPGMYPPPGHQAQTASVPSYEAADGSGAP